MPTNERAGGACRKPPKYARQLTKSPLKYYLKTVYKIISKSEFFYCHTYEFDFSGDVVEGWGGGGQGVAHAMYGDLPRLCLTLTCITGKDFTNVSPAMGCLQVICGHLNVFRVIFYTDLRPFEVNYDYLGTFQFLHHC